MEISYKNIENIRARSLHAESQLGIQIGQNSLLVFG